MQYILAGIGTFLALLVIAGMIMERFLKKSKKRAELLSMKSHLIFIISHEYTVTYLNIVFINSEQRASDFPLEIYQLKAT